LKPQLPRGIRWVGNQRFFLRLKSSHAPCFNIIIQKCLCTAILLLLRKKNMEQLTFLSEEHHASHSALQDSEADWMMTVATLRSSFADLLKESNLAGLSGKMSPVSCHRTEDGTLVPSLGRWKNSGMVSRTECLTLSTSEWPKDAVVCSLSDTLETGKLPQRFSLSATACQGILRRADKRGKKLPERLQEALLAVAQGESQMEPLETILSHM
jgi:hypothetical protein